MEMVQVAVLGVAGTLLAVQFKNEKPEYGIYISLAIGILLLFAVLDRLDVLLDALGLIRSYMRADTIYMGTLMKMLGITYVSEFASGLCKEAGHQSIASQIELFGKLTILALGIPVLAALLTTIEEFLA